MKHVQQMNIFEVTIPRYRITKPIRLIELFAGIGSQAMALRNIMANFVHWKVVEFDRFAINAYNTIHDTNFMVTDIRNVHASDLDITQTNKYEYIVTYSFPCQDLSNAGKKMVWQRVVAHAVDYFGKSNDYLKNAKNFHRFCSWKMCRI